MRRVCLPAGAVSALLFAGLPPDRHSCRARGLPPSHRIGLTRHAWEAQAVTSEGSGTSMRTLKGGCLRLEVARGQSDAGAGMRGRDTQLAEAVALAYRVRAVHSDGTVTAGTAPIPAGSTKP